MSFSSLNKLPESEVSGLLEDGELEELFPFLLQVSKENLVVSIGPSLARLCPELLGQNIADCFRAKSRNLSELNFDTLKKTHKKALALVLQRRELGFRGQVWLRENGSLYLLISPWCDQMSDLTVHNIAMSDFARHDLSVDLLFRMQTHKVALDDATRLAQRLDQERRELAHAKERTEEAEKAQSDFLSAMSHEIRTPLNGVLGMAQLLAWTKLDHEQSLFVHTLIDSGAILSAVISDILDFSKIRSGNIDIESSEFSLIQVVEQVADLVSPIAQQKGLEFNTQLATTLPRLVVGDSNRITQILLNLLNNAIKFTTEGTVVLAASWDEGTGLTISIEDTGIGIDAAAVETLFTPFTQAATSATKEFGGTGLGLSICLTLAECMGGSVACESVCGQGSTFTLSLPIHAVPPLTSPSPDPTKVALIGVGSLDQKSFSLLAERLCAEVVTFEHADELPAGNWARIFVCASLTPVEDSYQGAPVSLITNLSLLQETRKHWRGEILTRPFKLSALRDQLLSDGKEQAAPTPMTLTDNLARLRGTRVLIVEDNPVNQFLTKAIMDKLECPYQVAVNGQEAVDAVHANEFDLVLMDCQMPVMDGFEATQHIRADPMNDHLPIIAITAGAGSQTRQVCMDAGMTAFLTKPVKIIALSAMMVRVLSDAANYESE
ncbi:MAG: response regulator [Kofleriaceae bacterium]|nr:response regulator [Kofleriaceae bacterium]